MSRDGYLLDPPTELCRMREERPISRVTLWDGSTPWLVTRFEDIRALLADPRVSADTFVPTFPHMSEGMKARQMKGKTFINTDEPEHGQVRRKINADFTVKRVERLRPQVQAIVDGLIDDLLAGPKPADLVAALALPVPSLVICEILGVPYEDRALFHELSVSLNDGKASGAESAAAMDRLLGYIGELVDRKDAEPTDDLLGRLVVEQLRTGGMSRDEITKMVRLLLVAGHDTTANMIALGTIALLERPEQLALLQGEVDPVLARSTVEELLRYLTVTHSGRRRVAAEDIDYHGTLIRKGEGLIFAADVGNRDPRAFEGDPDAVELTRDSRSHVAFGFGVHQCLGQSLARLELQVVYGTLYRRIPTLALARPMTELEYKSDLSVYGVYELPVTW
jgi:cytochrome P450